MQTVLLVLLAFVVGGAIGFGLRKALRARREQRPGAQLTETFPSEPPAPALEAATGLAGAAPEPAEAEPAPQDKAEPEPKRRAASSKKPATTAARKAAKKKPAARKPRAEPKAPAAPDASDTPDTKGE